MKRVQNFGRSSWAMRSMLVLAAVLVAAVIGVSSTLAARAEPRVDKIVYGKFGEVTVYRTSDEPKRMVLFVSGEGGWTQTVASMARELSARDATVVGIDIRAFLRATEATKAACAYPAADFESLSQFVQKKLGFTAYHRPVLAGYSSGATLVYALLGQAPRGTFLGAISLGFCPSLQIAHPWCDGFGLKYAPRKDGHGADFDAMKSITEPWYVLQSDKDACHAPTFVAGVPTGKVVTLTGSSPVPQLLDSFEAIEAQSKRPLPLPPIGDAATPAPTQAQIAQLPLVEVPAKAGSDDTLAILLTGDGGWAGLDREIAAKLSQRGIPVVGLDSLSYFWNKRSPEETARDVAAVIAHYRLAWHKKRVILIGYSFGADVLPFVVNRLPADERGSLRLVTMIVPSMSADFEFHVAEWAGIDVGESVPTLPEAQRAKGTRTLCLYALEEKHSLCPLLAPLGAKVVGLPGGHHAGGDYDRLANEILAAAG